MMGLGSPPLSVMTSELDQRVELEQEFLTAFQYAAAPRHPSGACRHCGFKIIISPPVETNTSLSLIQPEPSVLPEPAGTRSDHAPSLSCEWIVIRAARCADPFHATAEQVGPTAILPS